jgi:hypothetical protein
LNYKFPLPIDAAFRIRHYSINEDARLFQYTTGKKLGIRENFRIRLINIPDYYSDLFTDWPPNVNITRNHRVRKNLIHFFIKKADELYAVLPV